MPIVIFLFILLCIGKFSSLFSMSVSKQVIKLVLLFPQYAHLCESELRQLYFAFLSFQLFHFTFSLCYIDHILKLVPVC